jgi:hypothetical protein
MQLVGDLLQTGLARVVTILCKVAICSGFRAGGLPPGWTDGAEPSSERFVAMACHSYVIDFVYTL